MDVVKFSVSVILFSFIYHFSWQKNIPDLNQEHLPKMNNNLQLLISNKRNQTGHRITLFSLNNTSPSLIGDWNADFKQNVREINGLQSIQVQGTFIVPPNDVKNEYANKTDSCLKHAGYSLFPGMGCYKLYNSTRISFNEALNTCFNDGGHLAIINSDEEANIVKKLLEKYPTRGYWVFLGFHDRIKQGEFTTIFGQHLNATGYNRWSPGEPDSQNVCGCCDAYAQLHTVSCNNNQPFLCEIHVTSQNL